MYKILAQKAISKHKKYALNAALVYVILIDEKSALENGCYICDGARSISYETGLQDYLEKYYGFRKAYCKLIIKYRLIVKLVVQIVSLFEGTLLKYDDYRIIHLMNSMINMEHYTENS